MGADSAQDPSHPLYSATLGRIRDLATKAKEGFAARTKKLASAKSPKARDQVELEMVRGDVDETNERRKREADEAERRDRINEARRQITASKRR